MVLRNLHIILPVENNIGSEENDNFKDEEINEMAGTVDVKEKIKRGCRKTERTSPLPAICGISVND